MWIKTQESEGSQGGAKQSEVFGPGKKQKNLVEMIQKETAYLALERSNTKKSFFTDNFWKRSLKKDFLVDKNTGCRRVSGWGLKAKAEADKAEAREGGGVVSFADAEKIERSQTNSKQGEENQEKNLDISSLEKQQGQPETKKLISKPYPETLLNTVFLSTKKNLYFPKKFFSKKWQKLSNF